MILPWIGLLPTALHAKFIAEFQDTARACIAVARFDRLSILLETWEATAEAYADPRLTADGSDLEYLEELPARIEYELAHPELDKSDRPRRKR
ncbi:MAG TPA: hypothetical protein VIU87_14010 [Mycobacterium sp.]